MTVWVLTLSNKPDLLPDACASVARQTRLADVVHLIQRDQGRDWGNRYPPSVFLNEMLPKLPPADFWTFLADDDLMLPNFVADLAGYLDAHPDCACVYGGGTVITHAPPLPDRELFRFPADELIGNGKRAIYHVGSGMSMARVGPSLKVGRMPEDAETLRARISDGIWLQRMADRFGIEPSHTWVTINRVTSRSAHSSVNERGGLAIVDWRRLRAVPAEVA